MINEDQTKLNELPQSLINRRLRFFMYSEFVEQSKVLKGGEILNSVLQSK